jgi:hypothetical protein
LPQARRLASCYLLLMAAYAGQLLFLAHWAMAPAVLVMTLATLFAMRQVTPQDSGAPRRLLLSADGRLHVATMGGAVEAVEPGGESLWFGSAILLVLRAPGRVHRVLLGRGNLAPSELATLRRRLRGAGTASRDPAVDSAPDSGHGVGLVQQLFRGIPGRGP